jgi:hypothetical protein
MTCVTYLVCCFGSAPQVTLWREGRDALLRADVERVRLERALHAASAQLVAERQLSSS